MWADIKNKQKKIIDQKLYLTRNSARLTKGFMEQACNFYGNVCISHMKSRFLKHTLNSFSIVVNINHVFCELSENSLSLCRLFHRKCKTYDMYILSTYENTHYCKLYQVCLLPFYHLVLQAPEMLNLLWSSYSFQS